jgi:hypothetical protein
LQLGQVPLYQGVHSAVSEESSWLNLSDPIQSTPAIPGQESFDLLVVGWDPEAHQRLELQGTDTLAVV